MSRMVSGLHREEQSKSESEICLSHALTPFLALSVLQLHHTTSDMVLTPNAKHQILLEYIPRSATHSFAALARRHAIAGGERTIRRWHSSWDGTPHSLNPKPRSGRPRILSAQQVEQHIATPIREANRNHTAIHYTSIAESVKEVTGKSPSLRTLQNYGKEQLKAKQKRTKKRRLDECQ